MPMTIDTVPHEITTVLEAERQRVAVAAAASRARLQDRLHALEAAVERAADVTIDITESWPSTAGAEGPPGPAPVLRPAASEPPPSMPPPAPAPALARPVAHAQALTTGRRLIVLGSVALAFVAHERYVTPWVAQNGQGQLRGDGAPALVIPKLKLDLAVAEGTAPGTLRQGPGHDAGSSDIGERGNVVIAGHRTAYGEPFARLENLEEGDTMLLIVGEETVSYTVESVRNDVTGADRGVRAQQGDDRLTLVTASSAGRVVVVAAAAEGAALEGELPPKAAASGALWPTDVGGAVLGIALWGGAAFALWQGFRRLRDRLGPTRTLLIAVPAATFATVQLFQTLEHALGALY